MAPPAGPRRPASARACGPGGARRGPIEIVECCGEEYDGYCCKRHHPDDDVECCSLHSKRPRPQPAAAAAAAKRAAAGTFARKPRLTAVGAVPTGHNERRASTFGSSHVIRRGFVSKPPFRSRRSAGAPSSTRLRLRPSSSWVRPS